MTRTLNTMIERLPAAERRQIAARAKELISEEMSLKDVRKAVGKTQVQIAKRLKVGQDAVSKLETRSDMYLSTLRDYVRAMGGELELVARFPGRPPVRLENVGQTLPRKRPKRAA